MRLNPSVTQKNSLSMLGILISHIEKTGIDLMPTDDALKPGHYDIRPHSRKDTISITDEPCITRILSRTVTGSDDIFRARVRERDGKCVITGVVNTEISWNDWTGFEAAHIFPLSSEEYFNELLMLSNIHQKFDSFSFSINPDDGYKITCFDTDIFRIELDPICRDHNNEKGVRDELLKWHFRQAALANMRGAGEPIFEMDFPPGSKMI
ncbi:hypothetical protein V1507DRAFT_500394 [Lipomyces tetrasporus]